MAARAGRDRGDRSKCGRAPLDYGRRRARKPARGGEPHGHLQAPSPAPEGAGGSGGAVGADGPAVGPDGDKALATLGREFHVTRMTFKNHTCCGHTFAAIDGAQALKATMGIEAAEIERLRVGTYKAALDVAGIEQPETAAEGRFSLKYVVATALTGGRRRFAPFPPRRVAGPPAPPPMKTTQGSPGPEPHPPLPHQAAAPGGTHSTGRPQPPANLWAVPSEIPAAACRYLSLRWQGLRMDGVNSARTPGGRP